MYSGKSVHWWLKVDENWGIVRVEGSGGVTSLDTGQEFCIAWQIANCICPNGKVYLFKHANIFVKNLNDM